MKKNKFKIYNSNAYQYYMTLESTFMCETKTNCYINEHSLTVKERKDININEFGIPELRKFPLIDKRHVILAISYFHTCPNEYKKELAQNILNKAKEYNIAVTNIDILKYGTNIQKYLKKYRNIEKI